MKKLFNNYGETLVEVIAASVILLIIGVAILNTLFQTAKFNISSGVEMKMKTEAEKAVEGIKANKGAVNLTSIGGLDYSAPIYYDKTFTTQVNSTDPRKYYTLTVKKDNTTINDISPADEYDRWDFKIGLKKYNNTSSQVWVFNSNGYDSTYSASGGKLYKMSELTSGTSWYGSNMSVEFRGTVDATSTPYRFIYSIGGTNGPSSPLSFMPGTSRGQITANANTIVLNIFRTDDNINDPTVAFDFNTLPQFTIDVANNTFYKDNTTELVTATDVFGRTVLGYKKNVIVNVYNDDETNPRIIINPLSPYITINRTRSAMPYIKNGYKINIKITDPSNKVIKNFPTVVE